APAGRLAGDRAVPRYAACGGDSGRTGRGNVMNLHYDHDELLADPDYAKRIRRGDLLFHGGLDVAGRYLPPRTRHRKAAIAAWTDALRSRGLATEPMRFA